MALLWVMFRESEELARGGLERRRGQPCRTGLLMFAPQTSSLAEAVLVSREPLAFAQGFPANHVVCTGR